ncbi:MAG: type I methionyl aminopeptidase [Defluviitaleaceae bacterium]|nr:type I methionyl aminopeptidase [Defluviitaleaceae bacterium]
MGIFIKNDEQVAHMRRASQIVAQTHALLARHIKPGVTTGELDKIAHDFILSQEAKPSFLGYHGYPASICVSVNEQVIHGIPGIRRLKSGDIVSIDIGVRYKHFHGDAARTHPVGEVSETHQHLIDTAKKSFFEGIKYAKAGNRLHEISAAIGDHVEAQGFSVVEAWCGHGIGRQLHEDPQIPHSRQDTRGPVLRRGMTLAIEPMINTGVGDTTVLDDEWTVVTKDGGYSAHYENTVLITDGEPDVLTL